MKNTDYKAQNMLFEIESDVKRLNGQYFTILNPFNNDGFMEWANNCNLKQNTILEPFAGSNNLTTMLQEMNLCGNFNAFDIEPKNNNVIKRDTLMDFPMGFDVCVTNPPYLAQNSAKRRGLSFPATEYGDLYKFALNKCLQNCGYVAAIIPASFLNANLFRDRLSHYILLTGKMFGDTEHPVCLALFTPQSNNVKIYENQVFIDYLHNLQQKLPQNTSANNDNIKFNSKTGQIGLYAIDNTIEASIYFCNGSDIDPSKIDNSSRSITRILIDCCNAEKLIKNLNDYLCDFRNETKDIFLTPFKGLRKDGKYRRRLDYAIARNIINNVINYI